jgi:Rps23 Pro-64 3,4-dihydroxylase Tpa1-like proline 4-hydroxylase
LLIYLNEEWEESYQGDLILASMDENNTLVPGRAVPPKFNTTVIFITDDTSFHGHPVPLDMPEGGETPWQLTITSLLE